MEAFVEKHGRRRVFFACFAVLATLLIVQAVLLHSAYNSISYKGNSLRVREVGPSHVAMTDQNGNDLHMEVEVFGSIYFYRAQTIRYLDETTRYTMNFNDDAARYTFSDGTTAVINPFIQIFVGGDSGLTALQEEEKRLLDRLSEYYADYRSTGIFALAVLVGLVVLLLAGTLFFYPEAHWHLQHFLDVRGGEPTDFYLLMSKISAFIIAAMVYVGFIYVIFGT